MNQIPFLLQQTAATPDFIKVKFLQATIIFGPCLVLATEVLVCAASVWQLSAEAGWPNPHCSYHSRFPIRNAVHTYSLLTGPAQHSQGSSCNPAPH